MKLIVFLFLQKYRLAKYLPESPADGKAIFYPATTTCLSIKCIDFTWIIPYWRVGSKDEKRSSESLSGTDSSS